MPSERRGITASVLKSLPQNGGNPPARLSSQSRLSHLMPGAVNWSTLSALLTAQRIKRIGYLYDMGDSWQHTLRLEKTFAAGPAASYPRLVDGAGRCPPEDCGGIPGFHDFLEAIADPQHPDHEDRLDWYGGPFEPADMDVAQINQELARIAARRKPTPPKDKL